MVSVANNMTGTKCKRVLFNDVPGDREMRGRKWFVSQKKYWVWDGYFDGPIYNMSKHDGFLRWSCNSSMVSFYVTFRFSQSTVLSTGVTFTRLT
jgi:hypothetical protein